MRAVETFVGCVLLGALVSAAECLPIKQPGGAAAAPASPACRARTVPALLCDRVTKDGRHECAVCGVEIGCVTATGIFCASSCDDEACRSR